MTTFKIHAEMSIEKLAQVVSDYIAKYWKEVLAENAEELNKLFPEYEDATYGMYLDKLLPPIWIELETNGYHSAEETKKDDFVIAGCLNFRNSMEKATWGTPNHEIRVFWIVIKNQHQDEIGTLLFELSHSHVQFELPAPPKFIAFKGTNRKDITTKIVQLKENSQ
ncbi:DUF6022 family protein [Paenibacillus lutimineralis]|uniref:Uncharacterized protein n=1 Tax=Paenibacillus lutimineralis TaxID=2707005 RepID=A0A3Q9IB53_9BACL|nr:DUF6022 family protein [Paenibacillus lutimineralis]AZS16741.1 hypothetical protein EI981_21270 [Paenibacillus lutimineralis]